MLFRSVVLQVQLALASNINLELKVVTKGQSFLAFQSLAVILEDNDFSILQIVPIAQFLIIIAVLGTDVQGNEISNSLILQIRSLSINRKFTSQIRSLQLSTVGQSEGYSISETGGTTILLLLPNSKNFSD